MDALNVLVTGAGAPGISGTLYSLKNNFDDRKINVIGTDAKEDVIGKYLCDGFYQIPKASEIGYIEYLSLFCKKESIDVVLPQNTAELSILAANKKHFESFGTKIAVSDEQSIEIANDKYKLMSAAKKLGVPTAEFYLVDTFEGLFESAKKLGWPEKPVVIKPPVSNGMRGVRIIDESVNLKEKLYSEKPSSLHIHMSYLKIILGNSFPSLLVMEYLPNDEWTVDIINANNISVITRKRDVIRSGITFEGTCEENEQMIEYSRLLSKKIGLEYAFGFQFKLDANNVPKLLESNPRIQGTMVLSTFAGANVIYGAVKHALGEEIPQFNIQWGTKIMRYWGAIGIEGGTICGAL